MENKADGGGLRYNEGKLRYDLFHPYSDEQLAKVFTMGAAKYAPRNWERGMKWSNVISSLKRHLHAIEAGEDYDKESGLLHAAHVMWNAHALTAYYKIFPQGDDRAHSYLQPKKIGLDIDGVLADFIGAMNERFPDQKLDKVNSWDAPGIRKNFDSVKRDKEFWLGIKPLITSIPFEPACYITARGVDASVTEQWLEMHNFPKVPVYCINYNESKVEVAKKLNIDIFVDDAYSHFTKLNNAGVLCYLFDAPHNQKYDVGHKRIKSLTELV